MKKKIIAIFMATMMSVSIAACGSSGGSADAEATPEVTEEAEATPEATEEAAEPTEEATDLEEAIDEADQAIQDAADATGTDVTTVDEATEAINEVAKGGGPATLDKYNQIENGMTYDEVKEIMGEDGIESLAAENEATNIQIYQWAGETPGSNISVSFMDDAVVGVEQVGLE